MNFITKKIQKCFFLWCFIATIGTINAQGIYTPMGSNIIFLNTQADVNALDTVLGTNTIIEGDIIISEASTSMDPITDLSAFRNITKIVGFLTIAATKSITTLSHEIGTSGEYAFNALDTITNHFNVGSLSNTTTFTNIGKFPNLNNIGGNFNMNDNASLTSIDNENFPALATIGGNLDINSNLLLSTIEGFPALKSVGDNFIIRRHDALTSIGDFSALTSIGGTLNIGGNTPFLGNDILTTLGDFSALTSIGNTITIRNNPKLSNCSGLPTAAIEHVENASPKRSVTISDNGGGCFADATLTTQANVDALSLGDATVFIGNITISEDSTSTDTINDLSVFKNITEIRGNLTITATTNLTTLSHETSTSGEYAFNALDTITGNFNVGSLATTTSLTTLGTFPNLISIGGALAIRDNEELQSLGDLSALETIGAYLRISHNEKLTDLGGLSALTSIGESDDVFVPSEDANIDSVSIIVEANTTLAACCNLTNLLPGQANAVTGSVFINSNAEGCNTADTGTDIEKVTAFVEACEATVVLSATGITAPTGTETNYTASAAAAGDTLTIDIILENATGWEVMITGTFVTSAPTMGNNDVDAVLTIAENTTTAERTGTITFTSTGGEGTAATQTLVITQLAAGGTLPTLTIASTGITAPTGGATAYTADAVVAGEMLTIDITLENATGWEVMITGAFVTSTPTMGNNDDNAVLTIAENTTTAERTDTITFTSTGGDATVSQTLIITQEAAEPTLAITGINIRPITSEAGTEDIIIASNTDFRVSTSDDLVTSFTFTPESGSAGTPIVPSSGSITLEGMGNGTLQIAYSENTTTDARTGTLTLSALDASSVLTTPTPITITLTQEAPATSPRLRIAASGITAPVGSETNYTYNASVAGETLTIDVTLTGGATDWTVIADAFVTSAPTTGNNDVDAVLTIAENTTTDERMATLIFTSSGGEGKIDTQTLVITQAAAAKIMLTSHAEGDSIAIAHDSTDPITIDFTLGGSATGWKDTIIYMPDTTNFVTMDTLKDDTISITITPSANTSAAPRTATITLITTGHEGTPDSVSLTIRQGARADTTVTLPPKDTTTLYSYTGVDFSLYPNPTKGNLTIEGITGYLQIYIHDLVGREVMTYSLTPSKKTIDVSNLPSGMYVVTVQAENKTWTEVLIIVN